MFYLHHNGGGDNIFIYDNLEKGINFSNNDPLYLEYFITLEELQNRVEELGGTFINP
tara:strand:- start:57 stop:227 length:171 start_codon:yes stop_codon:yes gene_type:complete